MLETKNSLKVKLITIYNTCPAGFDLSGVDRGLGHGSTSENPKWISFQIALKWRFLAYLGYFWQEKSDRAFGAAKMSKNTNFAEKWVFFKEKLGPSVPESGLFFNFGHPSLFWSVNPPPPKKLSHDVHNLMI